MARRDDPGGGARHLGRPLSPRLRHHPPHGPRVGWGVQSRHARNGRDDLLTLEECRAFYAQEIRFAATVTTPGLVEAFARVPREKFLGPPPWQVSSPEARALSAAGLREPSYVTVNDPRDLYHNVVVALDRAKDINNGYLQWFRELDRRARASTRRPRFSPRVWRRILHGNHRGKSWAQGSVVALELQSRSRRPRERKIGGPTRNVDVQQGDGAAFDPGPCDAMFVNCGVTHPQNDLARAAARPGSPRRSFHHGFESPNGPGR